MALAAAGLCFALGLALGRFGPLAPLPVAPSRVLERAPADRWVHPLLACSRPADADPDLAPLRATLTRVAERARTSGAAKEVSIYYRRLNSERSLGVDADREYDLASLTKLPMFIAWLHAGERDPALLAQPLALQPAPQADEAPGAVAPAHPLRPGESYPTEALLDAMVVDSDNAAFATLQRHLDEAQVFEPFDALHLPLRRLPDGRIFTSARGIGELLALLFDATWLDRESSARALETLSRATYARALAGGVPPGVAVAHKYGERTLVSGRTREVLERELHDCGVVYAPEHPYVLCVMTRGQSFDALAEVIRSASSAAYQATAASRLAALDDP